jgi:hypothetical protein
MSKVITLVAVLFLSGVAEAETLSVSGKEPVVVDAPDPWKSERDKEHSEFPFETYRVAPTGDRNVILLVSVLSPENREIPDSDSLKRLLKEGCRPYLGPTGDGKIEIKELKIDGVRGYYANFVDPDLVGKPVVKGKYKTATPMYLNLNSKYLISLTLLCDDLKGADYREAFKIAESVRVKKD